MNGCCNYSLLYILYVIIFNALGDFLETLVCV